MRMSPVTRTVRSRCSTTPSIRYLFFRARAIFKERQHAFLSPLNQSEVIVIKSLVEGKWTRWLGEGARGKGNGHAGSGAVVGVDRSHVDRMTVRSFELERLVVRDVDL